MIINCEEVDTNVKISDHETINIKLLNTAWVPSENTEKVKIPKYHMDLFRGKFTTYDICTVLYSNCTNKGNFCDESLQFIVTEVIEGKVVLQNRDQLYTHSGK